MKTAAQILEEKHEFRAAIASRYPGTAGERIWQEAERRLEEMLADHSGLPKAVRMHTDSFIFPAAALYLSLKEADGQAAFEIMRTVMKEKAESKGAVLAKNARNPLFARFFLAMWSPVSHKMFGEAAGFQNVFYPKEKNEFKMDITRCPYCTYLTELGCPELTQLFCDNDVYTYGSLPNLEFVRTQTLGRGGQKCDFTMRFKKETR